MIRSAQRVWLSNAIRRIEADFNRSADTHLIRVQLPRRTGVTLYLKDESSHPSGSLKHRLARSPVPLRAMQRADSRGHHDRRGLERIDRGVRGLFREAPRRQSKHLNNVIEQDHRAVKRITRPMLGPFGWLRRAMSANHDRR